MFTGQGISPCPALKHGLYLKITKALPRDLSIYQCYGIKHFLVRIRAIEHSLNERNRLIYLLPD